jgi:hypothetical protein
MSEINLPAKCYCGTVQMSIQGSVMFSVLCHCKPCTRFRGVSPVHLVGVRPATGVSVTSGEDAVGRVADPAGGKMEVSTVLPTSCAGTHVAHSVCCHSCCPLRVLPLISPTPCAATHVAHSVCCHSYCPLRVLHHFMFLPRVQSLKSLELQEWRLVAPTANGFGHCSIV